MNLECLFYQSPYDIPPVGGFVFRCSYRTYGCVCYKNDLDDLRKQVAGFLGCDSIQDVDFEYEVIFPSNDPLIILWMKGSS